MSRQTTANNLADLVRELGGEPKGTTAQLIDQLEGLAKSGAVSQEDIDAALERYMADPTHYGEITDADIEEIFSDGA